MRSRNELAFTLFFYILMCVVIFSIPDIHYKTVSIPILTKRETVDRSGHIYFKFITEECRQINVSYKEYINQDIEKPFIHNVEYGMDYFSKILLAIFFLIIIKIAI